MLQDLSILKPARETRVTPAFRFAPFSSFSASATGETPRASLREEDKAEKSAYLTREAAPVTFLGLTPPQPPPLPPTLGAMPLSWRSSLLSGTTPKRHSECCQTTPCGRCSMRPDSVVEFGEDICLREMIYRA